MQLWEAEETGKWTKERAIKENLALNRISM